MSWVEIRRSIPNALTLARFAAIPVFVWLYLDAGDGPAWGAGIFFAAAALTDQLDGYLARRWHVESAFGKVADPLADRLMIGTAAILMLATGRIPARRGSRHPRARRRSRPRLRLLSPGGYDLEVTGLGKTATWVLYASLGFVLVTAGGDDMAARAPVDRRRALPRRRASSTRCARGGRCTRAEGTLESSTNLRD